MLEPKEGPNATEKVEVCHPQGYKRHGVVTISVGLEIVSKQNMARWVTHQHHVSGSQGFDAFTLRSSHKPSIVIA
jgi:hypothetical protein